MLSCTGKRSHRHTILHVSFSNSFGLASARPTPQGLSGAPFCLYETQNMWTFIMLDTFTGKNWQVQFSTKGTDYMFAAPINYWSKAYPSSTDRWQGRFKMFATQNMWTFIMLDSFTGRLWQVQYDTKSLDNLLCVSINEEVLEAGNSSIFTIQPMTSMYQYYLISNKSGAMWQFQWTTKGPDYRWIKRVN